MLQPAIPEVCPGPAEVVAVDDLRDAIAEALEARGLAVIRPPDGTLIALLPDGRVTLHFRHGSHVPTRAVDDPAPSDQFPVLSNGRAAVSVYRGDECGD